MNWTHIRRTAVAALSLVLSSIVHAASSSEAELKRLHALAVVEGEVNILGANAEEMNWIQGEFSKSFPGISVKVFTDINAANRLIAESRAGRASVDIVYSSEALIAPMLERNLLAKPDWTRIGVASTDVGAAGFMAYTNSFAYAFVFNKGESATRRLRRWEDLADPTYRGKVAASPLLMARLLAALGASGDEIKMLVLARRLRTEASILWTNDLLESVLRTKERTFAAAMPYYLIDRWKENGIDIDYEFPEPVVIMQFGMVVTEVAPHPNAARLLAAWMTSDVGKSARKRAHLGVDLRPSSRDELAVRLRESGLNIVLDSDSLREKRNLLIPQMDREISGM